MVVLAVAPIGFEIARDYGFRPTRERRIQRRPAGRARRRSKQAKLEVKIGPVDGRQLPGL